jgi:hypothetical protein
MTKRKKKKEKIKNKKIKKIKIKKNYFFIHLFMMIFYLGENVNE